MQGFEKNSSSGFRGDVIRVKNQRRLLVAIFDDGLEPFPG